MGSDVYASISDEKLEQLSVHTLRGFFDRSDENKFRGCSRYFCLSTILLMGIFFYSLLNFYIYVDFRPIIPCLFCFSFLSFIHSDPIFSALPSFPYILESNYFLISSIYSFDCLCILITFSRYSSVTVYSLTYFCCCCSYLLLSIVRSISD